MDIAEERVRQITREEIKKAGEVDCNKLAKELFGLQGLPWPKPITTAPPPLRYHSRKYNASRD